MKFYLLLYVAFQFAILNYFGDNKISD